MEPQKVAFESTDITFHSRDLRPTQSFERAQEKARSKGSKVVRVYGTPEFVMDPKTKLVYLGFRFSDEIAGKIRNGELAIKPNTPFLVDRETQEKISDKIKRKLKNLARVWRKGK